MADYDGKILFGSDMDESGVVQKAQKAKEDIEKDPIKLNVEIKDIDKAKDYITKKLENNLEGIGEKFQRIKTEVNLIESGKLKGMYKAVETFANDLNETKKRVVIFKDAANGAYEEVSASVQKVIDHNLNYQQAMELTAKKLSTLNKEVRTNKIFDENGKWTGGWEQVTNSIMSSKQELRTVVQEEEEAGVLVRRIRQEVRKLNDDLTPKEDFQLFGQESIERINLAEQAYKKLNDKVREYKQLNEEVHRFSAIDKTGTLTGTKGTSVDNVWKTTTDQYGNQYQTQTRRWQDDLGNTIEQVNVRIRQQGKAWEDIGVISTKVSSDEIKSQEKLKKQISDKITLNNSYKRVKDGTLHDIKEEITTTKNLAGETEKVTKITDNFVDSQGRLVTEITKVDAAGNKTTDTLIKMGNEARQVGQSFTDVIVKVAKFYLASLPIRAVQKAITEATQAVKDFDSALTEFKKVSDLSGKSLDEYALKLEKLGELTARTRTEMMQMATEFKRSGYSDEDSARLAQTASLYQNIADEELSASDASAVLISQMKAFRFEADEAVHVIDSINEVANKNAVSSGDIGRGLTQAGAALSTYGNTFEETIGLITAGTEIFQGKSQQVARGLNTVASRVAKNEEALAKYGIQIKDSNNDLKSTYDVLSELAPKWEQMSKAEQVALGTTLAGVNQYKVFSAVMTNFNTALKATNDAIKSNGSAMKENKKYMDSIQARLQSLKAELQKFLLQGNALQNIFKVVISGLTRVMKFFNSFEGKMLIVTTLITSLVLNLGKLGATLKKLGAMTSIGKLFIALTAAIKAYTTGTISATTATKFFKKQLDKLNLNPYLLIIAAAIALIAGVTTLIIKLGNALKDNQKKLQEHKEKLSDINGEISDARSRLKEIDDEMSDINKRKLEIDKENEDNINNLKKEQDNLDDVKKKIDEINGKQIDIDKSYEDNIRRLKQEQEELKETIRLLYLKQEVEQQEIDKKAEKVLKSAYKAPSEAGQARYGGAVSDEQKHNNGENLNLSSKTIDWAKAYDEVGLTNERAIELANKNSLTLTESLEMITSNIKIYNEAYDRLEKEKEALWDKHPDTFPADWIEEDKNRFEEIEHDMLEIAARAKIARDESVDIATQIQEALDGVSPSAKGYQEAKDALSSYSEYIKGLGGTFGEAFGYVEEKFQEILDENMQEYMEQVEEEVLSLASSLGITSEELDNLRNAFDGDSEALDIFLQQVQNTKNKLDEASSSIDGLQSALSTTKQAQEEFNTSGNLTLDTFQSLLGVSTKYLIALVNEQGQIEINKNTLENLIGTMKKAKIEEIQQAAATDVMNYALGNTEDLSDFAKDALNNLSGEISGVKTEALSGAQSLFGFSAGIESMAISTGKITKDQYDEHIEGINKIVNAYQKIAESINNVTISTEDLSEVEKDAYGGTNSALKEQNDLLREQKQLLEEKKKQYDTVVSYIKKKIQDEIKKIEAEKKAQVDAIKEQIKALKDLKEEEKDRIDEQIEALKEQKSVEQEFWQAKIDALKEQNEALEEQLEYEQLLEDLAKAKSKRVRVYKEGQGFVYTEDGNEVDKAQAKIEEYERKKSYQDQLKLLESYKEKSEKNYEEQIKALEKLRDEKEKNYEEQIKALEKHQEEVEAAYDAQIAYFQGYLDKFTEQTDAYENETNRQLAIQLTGIDFEQQGWQKRLDNLADFVEKYNALLGDIHTLETGGNVESTDQNQQQQQQQKKQKNQQDNTAKTTQARQNVVNTIGGGSWSATADWYAKNYGGKKASGDSSISEDGMYLVGDSPNQELVIGSKLNGSLMSLSEGSGVVNATSTRTLAGVLNQLGLAGNQGINMSNSQNKSTNIQIGNISLPSVQNGKDFVDYLQNFSLQMTQEAFA